MNLHLSILDKSPIISGHTPARAVAETVKLAQAADVLARSPTSLQLRYLETLTTIAADKNSTIVFPLPIDLIHTLLAGRKQG